MNITKTPFSLLAAAVLALCTACAADWNTGDTLAEPQPLVFTATQGALTGGGITRAAADGTWEGNGTELVAIQIDNEVKKYKVTSTSGTLEPFDSGNTFYRTDTRNLSVKAWYPYSDKEPTELTITDDQSTKEKREKCNLMKASGTAVNGQTTIQLQFSHEAARIQLCLTDVDKTISVPDATVKFTVGGQTLTAYEDKDSEGKGTGNYSVLVAPETKVAENEKILTITVGSGETYTYTATAAATFKAGICYTYNISLAHSYLTFTASGTQSFKMTLKYGFAGKFQYSVGNGVWTTVTSNRNVTFGGTNGTLRLRGKSENGTAKSSNSPCKISFTSNVSVAASGDIRTLVDYENYNTAETGSARFCKLFEGCTALTKAPELPATTLAEDCYVAMFKGCTRLTSAPELPATKLASYCYSNMFEGCTALTKAPELPATTLTTGCYFEMFNGCSNLKEVTIKADAQLVSASLDWWLDGVASKGTFRCKKDFYDKISSSSFTSWPPPSGWTIVYITN